MKEIITNLSEWSMQKSAEYSKEIHDINNSYSIFMSEAVRKENLEKATILLGRMRMLAELSDKMKYILHESQN